MKTSDRVCIPRTNALASAALVATTLLSLATTAAAQAAFCDVAAIQGVSLTNGLRLQAD